MDESRDEILWNSRMGDFDSIQNILSKNADLICVEDGNGNNLLHLAAANGHIDVIKGLKSYSGFSELLNLQNSQGNTALHWAVLNRQHKIIEALIDMGAKFSIENSFNETAIDISIKNGDNTALGYFENASNKIL